MKCFTTFSKNSFFLQWAHVFREMGDICQIDNCTFVVFGGFNCLKPAFNFLNWKILKTYLHIRMSKLYININRSLKWTMCNTEVGVKKSEDLWMVHFHSYVFNHLVHYFYQEEICILSPGNTIVQISYFNWRTGIIALPLSI